MPTITGSHHIALTVSDAERSAAWYGELFGLQPLARGGDDQVSFIVLVHPPSGLLLGVRQYLAQPHDAFDEFRTGLDHLAFGVATRAELDAWVPELTRRGIAFSPVTDTLQGSVIVLRDPDGIQLELWLDAAAPPAADPAADPARA